MNRKRFLKQLGGSSLLALFSISSAKAFFKENTFLKGISKEKIIKADEGTQLHVLGNPQWHKVVGADTENQVFEWIDDLTPGSAIPPHIHSKEDEIFRVLQGQVEIRIDGKSTILSAGDMAYAPKNLVHSWKVVGDENTKMWVSAFPSGMEHMFQELHAMPPGPPDLAKVSTICETYGIQFV